MNRMQEKFNQVLEIGQKMKAGLKNLTPASANENLLNRNYEKLERRRRLLRGAVAIAVLGVITAYAVGLVPPGWTEKNPYLPETVKQLLDPSLTIEPEPLRRAETPTSTPFSTPASTEAVIDQDDNSGYLLHEYGPACSAAKGTITLSYDRAQDPNNLQVHSTTRYLPVSRQFKTPEGSYALKYCLEGKRAEDGFDFSFGLDEWGVGSETTVADPATGEEQDAILLLMNTRSLNFVFENTQSTSGTANDYGNKDSLANGPFAPMVPDFRNLPE